MAYEAFRVEDDGQVMMSVRSDPEVKDRFAITASDHQLDHSQLAETTLRLYESAWRAHILGEDIEARMGIRKRTPLYIDHAGHQADRTRYPVLHAKISPEAKAFILFASALETSADPESVFDSAAVFLFDVMRLRADGYQILTSKRCGERGSKATVFKSLARGFNLRDMSWHQTIMAQAGTIGPTRYS